MSPTPKKSFAQRMFGSAMLFFLLTATTTIVAASLIVHAAYLSNLNGNTEARVARSKITVTPVSSQWNNPGGRTDHVDIGNDMGKPYTFSIQNESEVAIAGYLQLSGNYNGADIQFYVGSPTNLHAVIADPFIVAPNETILVYLRFYARARRLGSGLPLGAGGAPAGTGGASYQNFVGSDANVSFRFEQVD